MTPFQLVFGLKVVMQMEFQILNLRIQVQEQLSEETEKILLATLCELEEHRIARGSDIFDRFIHPFHLKFSYHFSTQIVCFNVKNSF